MLAWWVETETAGWRVVRSGLPLWTDTSCEVYRAGRHTRDSSSSCLTLQIGASASTAQDTSSASETALRGLKRAGPGCVGSAEVSLRLPLDLLCPAADVACQGDQAGDAGRASVLHAARVLVFRGCLTRGEAHDFLAGAVPVEAAPGVAAAGGILFEDGQRGRQPSGRVPQSDHDVERQRLGPGGAAGCRAPRDGCEPVPLRTGQSGIGVVACFQAASHRAKSVGSECAFWASASRASPSPARGWSISHTRTARCSGAYVAVYSWLGRGVRMNSASALMVSKLFIQVRPYSLYARRSLGDLSAV